MYSLKYLEITKSISYGTLYFECFFFFFSGMFKTHFSFYQISFIP